MILRKPYAFLIKHFKLIHLFLSLLFFILLLHTGKINSFFVDYVNAGYTTNELNIASNYISSWIFVIISAVLIFNILIFLLMRQKEKNTKLYLGIIIFYMILLVAVILTHNVMNTIEVGTLSAQTGRVFRDLSFAFYVPQIFFFVYALLRGIGFDIKKFDFENDVRDLEVTDLDREEFEVTLGKNNYKYQRGFRRFRREFKYYFLENRLIFVIFVLILIGAVIGILYLNFGVYHRSYGQQQRMNHNGLVIRVVDSLLTNKTTNGSVIDKNKYFLAVALNVYNSNKESERLDYENFKVLVNGDYIIPTLDRGTYFPDLGIAYTRDMVIEGEKENTYVLVYEVPDANTHYDLRILESLENTLIGVTPIYKNIRLDYETIVNNYDAKTYELGKILDMSDTLFNVTELQIKSYAFANSYDYNYKKCSSNSVCQDLTRSITIDPKKYGSNKRMIILNVFFQLDQTAYYYQSKKNVSSFINDFVKIRAKIKDEVKEFSVASATPNEIDDTWLLVVDSEVEKGDKIDLLVTLHGKNYVMNLK